MLMISASTYSYNGEVFNQLQNAVLRKYLPSFETKKFT